MENKRPNDTYSLAHTMNAIGSFSDMVTPLGVASEVPF